MTMLLYHIRPCFSIIYALNHATWKASFHLKTQQGIQIPDIKRSDLRNVLFNRLESIKNDFCELGFVQNHWRRLYETCVDPFVKHLRDINRLTNALRFKLTSISSEVDLADMIAISVLEIHHPLVYEWIKNNKSKLVHLSDLYEHDRESNHVEDYQNYQMLLKGHLSFLQERYKNDTFDCQSFLQRETAIENDLTRTENYLRKILKAFQARTIDSKAGCQIIFTLCVVYAQTVNEFCCQYFYAHGIQHPMFKDWISVLDEIDSPAFREFLKRYFTFDREYLAVSPKMKQAAHHILFESVNQQKNRLMLCADMIKQLPEEQYIHLDDLLNQEVFSGLSIEIPELQGIDIDKVLTQRLEAEECWITDEDTVLIPLTV